MSAFYCRLCDAPRESAVCPVCGLPTERMESGAPAAPSAKTGSNETVRRPPPPPPVAGEVGRAGGSMLEGQKETEEFLEQGFRVLLIAGVGGSGKTELLEAYRADKYLGGARRMDGRAISTPHGTLRNYPFSHRGRDLLFVDASGEDFEELYQDPGQGLELREEAVDFLRVIANHLEGLVLLLKLQGVFQDSADVQVPALRNILLILRWLQGGGVYQAGARSFQNQVEGEVHRMSRLRIPVQLLLSKADEITGLELPKHHRRLYPVGEDPLAVAHHCAPKLLAALRDHARHFRIDFVHSLTLDRASGAVNSREGCGVELSAEWLLEASRLRRWPMIPTRWWLALDEHVLRRERWKRLPPTQKAG